MDTSSGGNYNFGIEFSAKGDDDVINAAKEVKKSLSDIKSENKKQVKSNNKIAEGQKKVTKSMKETRNMTLRMLTPLLSTMFVTQQISKSFSDMLGPANDLLGVQETLNDFLAVAFIPTAEENLNAVISWGEELINLSEATRRDYGEKIRLAQVTSSMVSGMAQAIMMGGSLGGTFGALALAGATVGASYAILTDKQATMVASIQGPLNTSIQQAVMYFGQERDAQNEVKQLYKELSDIGVDKATLDNLAMPGSVAAGSWQKAYDNLKKYRDELTGGRQTLSPAISTNLPSSIYPNSSMYPSLPPSGLTAKIPYTPKFSYVDDFISSGGRMYKTNPDDTIVGSKGGMSGTTNITVNVNNSGGSMNERYLAEKIGEAVRSELSGRAR